MSTSTEPEASTILGCGGQNKNNGVIHLCNYLVELEYFEEVEVVFFICGHTKNHCDRMFNAMKRTYRKDNVYTFSDLCEAWDVSSDNVTVVPVTANDFFAYDEYLDGLYIPIYDSELKKNHIFSAKADSPTKISIKKYRDCLPIVQNLENENCVDRTFQLENPFVEPKAAPGLKEIKVKEIITKWGKYLPLHIKPWDVCDMITNEDVNRYKK